MEILRGRADKLSKGTLASLLLSLRALNDDLRVEQTRWTCVANLVGTSEVRPYSRVLFIRRQSHHLERTSEHRPDRRGLVQDQRAHVAYRFRFVPSLKLWNLNIPTRLTVNSVAWAPHELGAILACASSDGKISVLTFKSARVS